MDQSQGSTNARAIKDAIVNRLHREDHDHMQTYLADFMAA